jgi:hypothetical protein
MSKDLEPKDQSQKFKTTTSDSGLVVDLPDGQKIMIGNLPSGTVVEIAAWRGTGAPDSRTSRLLIGAAGPEIVVESVSEEVSEKRLSYTKDSKDVFSILNNPENINNQNEGINKIELSPEPRTGKHSRIKSKKKEKRVGMILKSKLLWSAIAFVGIFVGLHFQGVAVWTAPEAGLKSGFGQANSMVAIANQSDLYIKGDLVVFTEETSGDQILVTVGEQVENVLLVGTTDQKYQTNVENIKGKVIFLIPFVGYIF